MIAQKICLVITRSLLKSCLGQLPKNFFSPTGRKQAELLGNDYKSKQCELK